MLICLPAKPWSSLLRPVLVLLGSALVSALLIREIYGDRIDNFMRLLFWILAPDIAFLSILGFLEKLSRTRQVTVEVTSVNLSFGVPGLISRSNVTFPRNRVRAVAPWGKLYIALDEGQTEHFLRGWDWNDLQELSDVLCRTLSIPEHMPVGPDEIAVRFSGPFWPKPVPGVIHAEPERLTLRHSLVQTPFLIVAARSSSVLGISLRRTVIRVDSDEVACKVDEAGAATLRIAPEGLKCLVGFPDGTGSLTRFGIPQVTGWPSQVRRLPKRKIDFIATIWCEDATKLTSALARFWGAGEKPGPHIN
jgi:hypothetical protein